MLIKHLISKPELFSHCLYSLQFRKRSNAFGGFFPLKIQRSCFPKQKSFFFFNQALKAQRKKAQIFSPTDFEDEKRGFFFPLAAVFGSCVLSFTPKPASCLKSSEGTVSKISLMLTDCSGVAQE